MQSKIVTAYAYSAKSKTYIYAAYVLEWNYEGLPKHNTYKVLCNYAVDECKAQARKEALERVFDNNERHPDNTPIEDKGRMPFDLVTNYCY